MAKSKRKPRRRARANPVAVVDEVEARAMELIEDALPEILEAVEDIKDDASEYLGYDIETEFPGIDRTIMRRIREEL